jgi:threonine dehydrogenase-like Zn-dependent dehydrogenase
VPAGVAVEDAVFAEPTAVALRAVLRSGAEQGSRVLVVGGGTLGWLRRCSSICWTPTSRPWSPTPVG